MTILHVEFFFLRHPIDRLHLLLSCDQHTDHLPSKLSPHSSTKPARSSSRSWGQVNPPAALCRSVTLYDSPDMKQWRLSRKLLSYHATVPTGPSAKRVLRTAVLRVLHHRHTRPMHGPGTLYIGSRPPRVSCMQGCSGVSNGKARSCLVLLYCTRPFSAKLPDIPVHTNTNTKARIDGSREA